VFLCGFSSHERNAEAGVVVPEPFTVLKLTDSLRQTTDPSRWEMWSTNAASYGADPQLYRELDRALQAILEID
jgi:hypothetical protein